MKKKKLLDLEVLKSQHMAVLQYHPTVSMAANSTTPCRSTLPLTCLGVDLLDYINNKSFNFFSKLIICMSDCNRNRDSKRSVGLFILETLGRISANITH